MASARHKDHRRPGLFLQGPGPRPPRPDFSAFVFPNEHQPDTLAALLSARARAGPSSVSRVREGPGLLRLSGIDMDLDLDGLPDSLDPEERHGESWWPGEWELVPGQGLRISGPADDPFDPLEEDDAWDRGSGSSARPEHGEHGEHEEHERHHHEHAVEHLGEHHAHDDATADLGVALISSGTTVFLACLSALFAMRLFRELMRPSGQQIPGLNAGPAGDVPGVLQLDIPGLQPFRPFSGQGYRLISDPLPPPEEARERKEAATPRSLSPVSAVSVAEARPSTSGATSAGQPVSLARREDEADPEVTAPAA